MNLDHNTWLRARAWALWKASFEIVEIDNKNSDSAWVHRNIINSILEQDV